MGPNSQGQQQQGDPNAQQQQGGQQQQQQQQVVVPQQGAQQQQQQDGGLIQLTPDVYNALLDRLDELEEVAKGSQRAPAPKNVDDLAQQGRQQQQQAGITDDMLRQMTPTQIVGAITQHLNETQIQPLLVKIEEMNVRQEIRELTRDGKNQDFFELKDEIFQIASKAPQLSLEEALTLARQKRGYVDGKPPAKKEGEGDDKVSLLGNLPPRRVIPGERQGASRSSMEQTDPETRMDAAKRALQDMKKAGKI